MAVMLTKFEMFIILGNYHQNISLSFKVKVNAIVVDFFE